VPGVSSMVVCGIVGQCLGVKQADRAAESCL
jgi:hypothetical protein